MKRLLVAMLLATLVASSSGCCIIDKLLHCPCGRWRGGGCGPCCDECAPCCGSDCEYTNGWTSHDGTWTEGTYNNAPSYDGPVYQDSRARPTNGSRNVQASYNARASRPQRSSHNARAAYDGEVIYDGPAYESGPVYGESGPAYSESGPAYVDSHYAGECSSCSGGACHSCAGGCGMGCCGRRGGGRQPFVGDSGPPTGAVGYPYYTTRGPRDFLARSPRPIGPY
ncbi:MAG: hypothetical protein AB7U73_09530 [Pirellulales bacterium]